jgi:CubicO group peptidase (beta-lactamase class C family)
MNRRRRWFWIIVGTILIAGLILGGLSISGRLFGQRGDLYEDPQGRFTMEVDPSWEEIETDGHYTQFKVANPPLNMYLLVLKASTTDEAYSQAFEMLGFDRGLLSGGSVATFDKWQAYSQEDGAGITYGVAGQMAGENAYLMVVKADQPGVDVENPAVNRALGSYKITGSEVKRIESYADLEAMVREQVDRLAGSASMAVVHKGDVVYTYAYGQANPVEGIPADTQTIFRYGSMTKPITAVALMQLVEKGKVALDAWPGEYIPEFPERWKVTVRQLLDHSACMPDEERLVDGLIARRGESLPHLKEVFSEYVKDVQDLVCEPGKVSNYANAHYLALARIIEEVSGEPYDAYVTDHLLTPLGMASTSFQLIQPTERYAKGQFPAADTDRLVAQINDFRGPGHEDLILQKGKSFSTMDDFRILPPWGGLLGTPDDLTHFLQMILNGGRYGDQQILKPKTIAAMQEMQRSTQGSPLGIGLSWWIGEDDFGNFYYHKGGGVTIETTMRYYPELDLGVVVMGSVNGYQAEAIAANLVSAWTHENDSSPCIQATWERTF